VFSCRMRSTFLIVLMMLTTGGCSGGNGANTLTLRGTVESGGTGLKGYEVALYGGWPLAQPTALGRGTSDASGKFAISYRLPPGLQPVLFINAERGSAMLVSAIGRAPISGPVVVNERTTIATGFAFAQFVKGQAINGNQYGVLNAVHMAANLVDPQTGKIADVLGRVPNGAETSALRTFNSLANIVADCVGAETGCQDLFDDATVPGGPRPNTVLQAVANIAKYPWSNVAGLFDLSFRKQVYAPALAATQPPDAWTLFLKFTGGFYSKQNAKNLLNGPGNFAIDSEGFLWVNDNYTPIEPSKSACPGKRVVKFYPWGENFPGSPYFGGGVSGSGFGISIAPDGNIWVGNFGFNGVGCPLTPSANSVSVFRPNGQPLSPDKVGFTAGPISWPQATVPDRNGTIWIASCASDAVTIYPKGDPNKAFAVPIPHSETSTDGTPVVKPFGIAIDDRGDAWVAGNSNSTLTVLGPKGDVIEVIPSQDSHGVTQIRRPMGVASDSRGNIWVANSDWVDPPCPPTKPNLGPGTNPSIALFLGDRSPYPDSPFSGGGLSLPWGIAVDGNDTVWVANFGFPITALGSEPAASSGRLNRVSHFCGVDTAKCPPTKQEVGKAISPDVTGYTSDALDRNTGIAIDPSGNVWLANNWKEVPLLNNPGQNSIAVLIGAAAPLKTPLIGTPESFN
jgi:hypothetical protein